MTPSLISMSAKKRKRLDEESSSLVSAGSTLFRELIASGTEDHVELAIKLVRSKVVAEDELYAAVGLTKKNAYQIQVIEKLRGRKTFILTGRRKTKNDDFAFRGDTPRCAATAFYAKKVAASGEPSVWRFLNARDPGRYYQANDFVVVYLFIWVCIQGGEDVRGFGIDMKNLQEALPKGANIEGTISEFIASLPGSCVSYIRQKLNYSNSHHSDEPGYAEWEEFRHLVAEMLT